MNERRIDCLCAGIIVADHICEPVDHVPAPGELVLTSRMDLSIGGCASNVAVDLTKLGRRASVVGRVGKDVFGHFVKDALESAGVKTEHISESPERDTSGSFVINCTGEDRRFVHSIGANGEFQGDEITPELIQSSRVLYLGGYCLMPALTPEKVAELFRQARSEGVITLLDVVIPAPGDYWPQLAPVLPYTDIFLPNNDEGRLITGKDDPFDQAEEFQRAGAQTVVVTCGGEGTVLRGPDCKLRTGVFPVEFIDGTGSGDAFVAGYINGLLDECDPVECLRQGSALGASSVRATGATTGVFTRSELDAFIASNDFQITAL